MKILIKNKKKKKNRFFIPGFGIQHVYVTQENNFVVWGHFTVYDCSEATFLSVVNVDQNRRFCFEENVLQYSYFLEALWKMNEKNNQFVTDLRNECEKPPLQRPSFATIVKCWKSKNVISNPFQLNWLSEPPLFAISNYTLEEEDTKQQPTFFDVELKEEEQENDNLNNNENNNNINNNLNNNEDNNLNNNLNEDNTKNEMKMDNCNLPIQVSFRKQREKNFFNSFKKKKKRSCKDLL